MYCLWRKLMSIGLNNACLQLNPSITLYNRQPSHLQSYIPIKLQFNFNKTKLQFHCIQIYFVPDYVPRLKHVVLYKIIVWLKISMFFAKTRVTLSRY